MRQFFLLLALLLLARNNSCFKAPPPRSHLLTHIDTQHDKLTVEWRSNSFVVILQNTHLKFIVLVIVVIVDIYYRIVFVVVIEIVGACRAHLIALDVPTFIKIAVVVVFVVARLWQ